ncbi:hypothetical protein CBR_g50840 [Chara braunii]|uniref:histone acetyltransferase n=1 Tax=Chara braunii TaxID=69332 RepID=A0A388M7N1_CHABU|nr:hypothetical protein CBR_g50840 [Chara braunii]|eukprot:GBG90493.1 hypothetical protein CBR_g50840 [Chara braunii]
MSWGVVFANAGIGEDNSHTDDDRLVDKEGAARSTDALTESSNAPLPLGEEQGDFHPSNTLEAVCTHDSCCVQENEGRETADGDLAAAAGRGGGGGGKEKDLRSPRTISCTPPDNNGADSMQNCDHDSDALGTNEDRGGCEADVWERGVAGLKGVEMSLRNPQTVLEREMCSKDHGYPQSTSGLQEERQPTGQVCVSGTGSLTNAVGVPEKCDQSICTVPPQTTCASSFETFKQPRATDPDDFDEMYLTSLPSLCATSMSEKRRRTLGSGRKTMATSLPGKAAGSQWDMREGGLHDLMVEKRVGGIPTVKQQGDSDDDSVSSQPPPAMTDMVMAGRESIPRCHGNSDPSLAAAANQQTSRARITTTQGLLGARNNNNSCDGGHGGSTLGISRLQRWLLLLTHSSICSRGNPACAGQVTCRRARQLCNHINGCRKSKAECDFPLCAGLTALLLHHRMCQSPRCQVCGPVREQYTALQCGAFTHTCEQVVACELTSSSSAPANRSGQRDNFKVPKPNPTMFLTSQGFHGQGLFNADLSQMDKL